MHKKQKNFRSPGFTLIELLVVIAIIAILSVVVILTLNPAELLKQARDSNRISDLSTLKSAISLYLTDVKSPNLASNTVSYAGCYISPYEGNVTFAGTYTRCGVFQGGAGGPATTSNISSTQPTSRKVNSAGWIPVDFSQ